MPILARAAHISEDISHLLGYKSELPTAWQSHLMYQDMLLQPPLPLVDYVDRLRLLADTEPELLLAHAYVRSVDSERDYDESN